MSEALGLVETKGLIGSIEAADATLRARGVVDPIRFARLFATWPA